MDPATIVGVAATAGAAIVAAMATDAWYSTKQRLVRMAGRRRSANTAFSEEQLEQSRKKILELGEADYDLGREEEVGKWTAELERLMQEDPDVLDEVRDLVSRLTSSNGPGAGGPSVTQQISAGRDSYTAGRDQHFGPRPSSG